MVSKSLLLSVAALVVVTWVLISSISTIPQISQGTQSNTGSQGNGGTSNNQGSSSSSSQGKGFSNGFLLGNFTFPHLNLPKFGLNLSFFNIRLPLFHFNFPLHFPKFGSVFGFLFNGTNNGNYTGNSTGSGKTGNTNGNGNTPTNTLRIPPYLLDIILAAMVVLIAVIGSVSAARYRRRKKDDGSNLMEQELLVEPVPEGQDTAQYSQRQYSVQDFHGWKTGNDVILPSIPDNLPLIYPFNEVLPVHLAGLADLQSHNSKLEKVGDLDFNVSLERGCSELKATWGEEQESKLFRGVDIRLESSLLLELNLFSKTGVNSDHLTAREILGRSEIESIVKNRKILESLLDSYEKTYYGLKHSSYHDFQGFLYGIRDAFIDPKIASCGW